MVWTIWLNAFVEICASAYLGMYLPSYFKFVLNYGIEKTGYLASLPTLMIIPTRIIFGYASDKIKFVFNLVIPFFGFT